MVVSRTEKAVNAALPGSVIFVRGGTSTYMNEGVLPAVSGILTPRTSCSPATNYS